MEFGLGCQIPSLSSLFSWFLAAPKRKKPRLVKYDDGKPSFTQVQSHPIPAKLPSDQFPKTESSSANPDKNAGSAPEIVGVSGDTAQSHAVPPLSESPSESMKVDNSLVSDSKPASDKPASREFGLSKEEPQSPKKEASVLSRLDDKRETATATKLNSTTLEIESQQRDEKFPIDLMALPPSRSSPERDGEIDFVATDAKPMATDTETEIKPLIKDDNAKTLKLGVVEHNQQAEAVSVEEPERPKSGNVAPSAAEESQPKRLPPVATAAKERSADLQLDLENSENKFHHHVLPRQYQPPGQPPPAQAQPPLAQPQLNDKTVQSGALPLPAMSMLTWPGGLPPMGYMTPLQGVVSMDGTPVSTAAIQPPPYIFNQPRPKRCATHCHIARSIHLHQQITRLNPFWPAAAAAASAAGSGPVFGAKPCNLNILPTAADMHGNIAAGGGSGGHHRVGNPVQDKGQSLTMFPSHNEKDKASMASSAGVVDQNQRKQILLQQQALPPGTPSNLLPGPAIIFPMSQQQVAAAAAAASVRPPNSVKSPPAAGAGGVTAPSNGSNPTAAVAAAGAQAMTFNYPNMSGNEPPPQYLAINAYPFPIPAHVGASPAGYRGTHPQPMPFFNGSYYSSFYSAQPPQQQQQQQPTTTQQQGGGHQNPSMSSGSSSTQKHLQNQQQRQSAVMNGGNSGGGSLQGYPTTKSGSSQPQQQQQQQRQSHHHHHMAHPAEMGGEDNSPSTTAESRVSRPNMSIYSPNFAMPIHAPNFALMTPPSAASPAGAGGEKKQPQLPKATGEQPPQAFAMSFAAAAPPPGLDLASLAQQQQAMFSDVRSGYHQYMAAAAAQATAAAVQHKKSYRGPEDSKPVTESSNAAEEDRKTMKNSSSAATQSIAFSRPDSSDSPGTTATTTTVVDRSARTLNLGGGSQPRSSSLTSSSTQQRNLQHQHQLIQMQKQQQQQQQQQQLSRSKAPPASSNGGGSTVYSDHHHLPPSMAAKFPNALSTFPQSLVHGTSPTAQSQWKNSSRSTTTATTNTTTASQAPSPSTSSSLKTLPQQHLKQQTHTQISFSSSVSQKTSVPPPQTATNQSQSPPIMVGSPTTSSVSKTTAGGSPRTTVNPAPTTGSKIGQSSSLSTKSSSSSTKTAPTPAAISGGKNAPSILGSPYIISSSSPTAAAAKSQQIPPQQLQQQQTHLSKQSLQQAQLYFSSYLPSQVQHHPTSAATSPATTGGPHYSQRRRSENNHHNHQPGQGGPGAVSTSGMLSLSPAAVTISNAPGTSDPSSKTSKGLPAQAIMHPAQYAAAVQSGSPHQILPAGFPYVHAVPAGVQVKPAEQKQPAGE